MEMLAIPNPVKPGRPVPGLVSRWAQDMAGHGLSCNLAQARSADKHLRLNEIYEHWQEKHLDVRYCSVSPAWAARGCSGLIEDNSLEVWAVMLSWD